MCSCSEGFMSAFKCQNILQAVCCPDDSVELEAVIFHLIIPIKKQARSQFVVWIGVLHISAYWKLSLFTCSVPLFLHIRQDTPPPVCFCDTIQFQKYLLISVCFGPSDNSSFSVWKTLNSFNFPISVNKVWILSTTEGNRICRSILFKKNLLLQLCMYWYTNTAVCSVHRLKHKIDFFTASVVSGSVSIFWVELYCDILRQKRGSFIKYLWCNNLKVKVQTF